MNGRFDEADDTIDTLGTMVEKPVRLFAAIFQWENGL
jgi:hypothetical protein